MEKLLKTKLLSLSLLFTLVCFNQAHAQRIGVPSRFISHIVNPADMTLSLHWKDENNQPYRSFSNLKNALAKKKQAFSVCDEWWYFSRRSKTFRSIY